MGAGCTLLLLLILMAFAGYKSSVLHGKRAIDILSAVQENAIGSDYVFGADQGLNIAVAVLDP